MASPQQQEANQANAQHSTGPKTPDGKARSAANARTHGFCSQEILIAAEEREEFDTMSHGYGVDLAPETETEKTLFDEILAAAWQLRRMRRMETVACSGHDLYTAILDDEVPQKKLERLARHKTRFERAFHRCLKQFKIIQNARYEEEKTFHSLESLIAERIAKQNSERTQPDSEQTQPEPEAASSNPLPPDYFEKINREFEEIDRGLANLGVFVTPPKPNPA